jgi:diguanylate cyclase (GGDEF)-like protein
MPEKKVYGNLKAEIFFTLLVTLFIYSLWIAADFIEFWFNITRQYERYELDELLGLVISLTLGLSVLSTRLALHYLRDNQRIFDLSENLFNLAYFNQLTGLPNHHSLKNHIQKLIPESSKHSDCFTLFYIDLDSFKYVNDMLGYKTGDMLLMEITSRLKSVVTQSDFLAHIGGDEFCIVQPMHVDDDACMEFCNRLNQIISEDIVINGHKLNISQTIGISRFPEDGTSYGQLLRIADTAMLKGKKPGQEKNNLKDCDFIADMHKRFIVQHDLSTALDKEELFLLFQPKIDCFSETISSVEALVRWQHPNHGLIPPDDFIPIAEEECTAPLIDLYVFDLVCQQLKRWGDNAIPIAVNFSPANFADVDFPQKIFKILRSYEIEPHMVIFEITERTIVSDSNTPLSVCEKLSKAGIRISLDDFGTGYSSLSHITKYPINEIKIDRCFIAKICKDQKTRLIVNAIIGLAKAFNISIVAEGVETEEQYELIKELDCSQAQGYLIDKPLTIDALNHRMGNTA